MKPEFARIKNVRTVGVVAALVAGTLCSSSTPVAAWSFGSSMTKAFAVDGFVGGDVGTTGGTVAQDSVGNIFVTGMTAGTMDLDPSAGVATVGNGNDSVSYLAKYSSKGVLLWAHDWEFTTGDPLQIMTMAVAPSGHVLIGGTAPTMDLDPTSGIDSATAAQIDPFVIRINADGSYAWGHTYAMSGTSPSGTPIGLVRSLAVTSSGGFIAGIEHDGSLTLPGATIASTSRTDVAIVSFGSDGTTRNWHSTVAGTSSEWLVELMIAGDGSIRPVLGFSSGTVSVTGSDGTSSSVSLTSPSSADSLLLGLRSDGTVSHATSHTAGASSGYPVRASVSAGGSLVVLLSTGAILTVDSAGVASVSGTIAVSGYQGVRHLTNGDIIIVGAFAGTVDFDIGSGVQNRTSEASLDAGFVLRLDSSLRYEDLHVIDGPIGEIVTSVYPRPDGGFLIAGASYSSTGVNLSNTSYDGVYTRSASADSFMFVTRYDAAGTTGLPAALVAAPSSARYTAGNKKATITWSSVPGAHAYTVSSPSGEVVCTVDVESCVVSGLRNGRISTHTVRAVNEDGVVSTDAREVRVIAGFTLGKTIHKVGRKPKLSSILDTPSKGKRRWTVVSGRCVKSGTRLVMPSRKGTCRLKLTVGARSSYPSMTSTVRITVTR